MAKIIINHSRTIYLITILLTLMSDNSFSQEPLKIIPKPPSILIEKGDNKQILNFDFLVSNESEDTIFLNKLIVSVFDTDNNLLHSRFLDNNGTAPSIFTLPKRIWNGRSSILLFNPFSEFELKSDIAKLEYEWSYSNKADREFTSRNVIYPKKYIQETKLLFPLKGRVLVYDAHDFSSHHRRFDFNFEPIKQLGLESNFMRYAYDFVILDKNNKLTKNNSKADADYYSLGAKVYAVASGKVIYVSNTHKDDKSFDIPRLKENPLELYGNCIAIQHSDSSVSIYGHLKEKSVKLSLNDKVAMGQELGEIGISGSSFFPHLHFEMRTSVTHSAEGIPSYFRNIYLLEGKLKRKINSGLVETGAILLTE